MFFTVVAQHRITCTNLTFESRARQPYGRHCACKVTFLQHLDGSTSHAKDASVQGPPCASLDKAHMCDGPGPGSKRTSQNAEEHDWFPEPLDAQAFDREERPHSRAQLWAGILVNFFVKKFCKGLGF